MPTVLYRSIPNSHHDNCLCCCCAFVTSIRWWWLMDDWMLISFMLSVSPTFWLIVVSANAQRPIDSRFSKWLCCDWCAHRCVPNQISCQRSPPVPVNCCIDQRTTTYQLSILLIRNGCVAIDVPIAPTLRIKSRDSAVARPSILLIATKDAV